MRRIYFVMITLILQSTPAIAVDFNSGSNGSFGAIVVDGDTSIDLPPDGIIHATTVMINSGILTFSRNALNTPVYLLATGDIVIASGAIIDVNATSQFAGPGGFEGGIDRDDLTDTGPSAGFGPGAGLAEGGFAGFKTDGGSQAVDGKAYGNALLMPIIGGSGGGGSTTTNGGHGGGAIVIASNTAIILDGNIQSQAKAISGLPGRGSGGAIRLVAPSVTKGTNTNSLSTFPNGRSRIDVINRFDLTIAADAIGSFMQVFPPVNFRLDIIDVAGQNIPEGTSNPVSVTLPLEAPAQQTITVQGRDFVGIVPVRVVITPESGDPIVTDTQLDMSSGNPATVTVDVDLPQNVPMRVHAWTM